MQVAGPTGFEPAISSVTGRRDRPLHYEPASSNQLKDRGNDSNSRREKQTEPWGAALRFKLYVVMRRLFGLERLGVGGDRLEVELHVSAVQRTAAAVEQFGNI